MKEKIINIRNILKIIISLFIIFAMIKSCSKAYTWNELEEYSLQLYADTNVVADVRTASNLFYANRNILKNLIEQKYNTTINNYTSFWVWYNSAESGPRIHIACWNYNPNIDFSGSGGSGISTISTNNATFNMYYRTDTQGTSWNTSTLSMSRNKGFGLINTTNTDSIYSGWYLQNKYTPAPALEFVPMGDGDITVDGIQHVQKLKINAYHIGWIKNYNEEGIPSKTTWDFYLLNPEEQEINLTDKTNVVYEGQQIYWYIVYDDWIQWHKLYRLRVYFEGNLYRHILLLWNKSTNRYKFN